MDFPVDLGEGLDFPCSPVVMHVGDLSVDLVESYQFKVSELTGASDGGYLPIGVSVEVFLSSGFASGGSGVPTFRVDAQDFSAGNVDDYFLGLKYGFAPNGISSCNPQISRVEGLPVSGGISM